MARVFVDTSAVYALLDRDDANHALARERIRGLQQTRAEPLLSNFVVAEIHALLLARLGRSIARRWLLENIWRVERVTEEDEARARSIIEAHEDNSYSYTDATSFALMDRLRIRRALAFDRHFAQYGVRTE